MASSSPFSFSARFQCAAGSRYSPLTRQFCASHWQWSSITSPPIKRSKAKTLSSSNAGTISPTKISALKLDGTLTTLVEFLKLLDPAAPWQEKIKDKDTYFVREGVALNHMTNCMLYPARSHSPGLGQASNGTIIWFARGR